MKILALKSTGKETSISVILNDEINSFSMSHNRKDRPVWNIFLDNVGNNKTFILSDIDLFAFGDDQNSYTATRTVASYMKGLAVALDKPLMSIEENLCKTFNIDSIAQIAKQRFIDSGFDKIKFDPKHANPKYEKDLKFKKLNE